MTRFKKAMRKSGVRSCRERCSHGMGKPVTIPSCGGRIFSGGPAKSEPHERTSVFVRKFIRKPSVLLIVLAALALTGCFGKVIAEDEPQSGLKDIDPADGIAKEIEVTLYYRLANENYLAGINRTITVRAGERGEAAVIRALIEGVPPTAADLSPLFPPGTSLIDTSYKGNILYVTLSGKFLDDTAVSSLRQEDYPDPEGYKKALEKANRELYTARRLAVLSIVNTISGSGEDIKVQVLVESKGDGAGKRPSCVTLGFEGHNEDELIEPMGFDADAVAVPRRVAQCFFEHMVHLEYEMAYALIAKSDHGGAAIPEYADFEAEVMTSGTIESCEVGEACTDENGLLVTASVRISEPGGTEKLISNAKIYMRDEGGLYKVDYGSVKMLMES